ncbi:hypothetical protein [Treponema sp. R80B11-R83G3]
MKSIIKAVFIVLIAISFFITCESPMGMGKQVDFEPPVLTLDPVPSPYYVRDGSILSGTVTDNEVVDRVIFINSVTEKELFPVKIDGNNWRIDLEFTEEQNGEKIVGKIVAYDKAGNSGEPSIAFVTMIIDIRPPVVDNITIQRTDTRISRLEPLRDLKNLETTDPSGEKKDELYRYQNGWFYLSGVVNDEETKIEIISLDFYDVTDGSKSNTILLSLSVDENYTNYFPRWTIKEDDIINAGVTKWGTSYKTDYYGEGKRYYYRVVIKAIDKCDNENIPVEEDEGCICLFAKSDNPKGILDPAIGTIISRGTPLPIDFYDDDSIDWAYAGLLTYEQWEGLNAVCSGDIKIPSEYSDEQKLEWLKDKLRGGGTVYNWRFDAERHGDTSKDAIIAEQIEGKKLDEKLVYIPTGNQEEDYGEFVLFTLTADKKLAPHDGKGPEFTNKNGWAGRILRVQVIDENAPLIVFDTTKTDKSGNPKDFCPEENTFPTPLINGESFNIVGYTLRENASGNNSVVKFRMAWIPYGMPDNADKWIPAVQNALRGLDETGKINVGYPVSFGDNPKLEGVQHWEFVEGGASEKGDFKNEGKEDIDTSVYKKQSFIKKFNVLGGSDDIKPATDNFKYNGNLENETKLFIFYAEDNMGHQVFRQLRLLGMKTPPDLSIYDITNIYANESLPGTIGGANGLPDPNKTGNIDVGTGIPTDAYYNALNTYNNTAYGFLKGVRTLTPDDKTIPFQIYPRGTIVKYWVNAAKTGDIAVKTISMKDITFEVGKDIFIGSDYSITDEALSFCEYYPDVTQRTFLFEATDKLGNVARVQRTIAVTNAARLENITTTTQNGTYGINTDIILKANFSSQIYVEEGTSQSGPVRPYLNVRYKFKGEDEYRYERIRCEDPPTYANPSLSLDFKFNVRENFIGQLETTYEGMPYDDPTEEYNRPIMLYNAKIMDYIRNDPAFVPGYKNESVTMPNWQTKANTLQEKKNITLDGVRPVVKSIIMGGKNANTANNYYFKTGETIELTIEADKPIRANIPINPTLRFYILDSSNTRRGPFNQPFKYQRPGIGNQLVFSLPIIPESNISYDGKLTDISFSSSEVILDDVGNSINTINIVTTPPAPIPWATDNYYIKQKVPDAPAATLDGALISSLSESGTKYYVNQPNLVIPDSTATAFAAWEDTKQYSLDNGVSWETYSAPIFVKGGAHTIRTRYMDRAGNEGPSVFRKIEVEGSFPQLVSVNAVQANGYYKAGSNLTFNLNFAETVTVNNRDNVTITVRNRNTATADPNETQTLTTNMANNASGTTITFYWSGITGKEMRDGLYISAVTLTGLSDKFGNTGPTGSGNYTTNNFNFPNSYSNNCPNLAAGIRVDAILPSVSGRTPDPSVTPSGNGAITQIKLTFSEPVMKGSGAITVKPHGNYSIPPVFEDEGYYLGTDGTRNPTYGAKTYISSFYDIYNNSSLDSTDRGYLLQGDSMSSHTLNARTGQSAGPYKKTTQGLVAGRGYSGNYTGANVTSGTNAPDTATGYMIPDTATKWVLDYQYVINDTTANSAVSRIRGVLTKAKFRWQEIDVSSTSISGSEVTINLNEPLLKGLEWDVTYPAGAFTDMAGNSAVEGTADAYIFTSPGVQPPVIRVNRRSYDARTANWQTSPTGNSGTGAYANPANTTPWDVSTAVNDNNGWGIGNFNTVHYRVESESLGVTMTVGISKGVTNGGTTDITYSRAAKGAWSGTVLAANTDATSVNAMNWTAAAANTAGTWVLNNIIRRSNSGTNTSQTYTVITKNGISESRTSVKRDLRMFRSYNRDLTASELDGITLSQSSNGYQGVLTFDPLESNKSYVAAQAEKNGQSAKGYEGIYRTVVALNFSANKGNNYLVIEGSNIKNGMPSVAGFPVRDAAETGDRRFIKVFYNQTTNGTPGTSEGTTLTNTRTQFYWVSTEIVCEWYLLYWGGNGTHQNAGEVNNYLTVGYGDLTYAYDLTNS